MTALALLGFMFLGCENQRSDSKSLPDAFISRVTQNVLFYGIDNPVYIYVKGRDIKDLAIDIKGGSLTPIANENIYNFTHFIKPDPRFEVVEIAVFDKNDNKKEIANHTFKVKRIPYPILTIVDETQASVSKSMFVEFIKKDPEIKGKMEYFSFEDLFAIKSFNMVISSPTKTREFIEAESGESLSKFVYGGEASEYSTNGNKLSAEMITAIENSPIGTNIYFESIVFESLIDTHMRIANAMVFTLN